MAENMKWIDSKCETHVVPKSVHGVPTYIDAGKDFKVHPGYSSDGQFVAANLKGDDGREFGVMLHIMCVNPEIDPNKYPVILSIITMSDFTNHKYMAKEDACMAPNISYSEERLDVTTPVSYIRGNADTVECGTDLPDGAGRIDLKLKCTGPVLYNCATGQFPFLNDEVLAYQYSVPTMEATGTMKLDGREYKVSGPAWLDRQWGNGSEDFVKRTFKWKWMNLQLNNGYRISVWDVVVNDKKENAWATVLSPEGAHFVVDIEPFSKGEGEFYTGKTGQIYPTKYRIEIPQISSYFDVKVRDLPEQEIVSAMGEDKYEAACTFTGSFMGKEVEGFNYVELVGSFR